MSATANPTTDAGVAPQVEGATNETATETGETKNTPKDKPKAAVKKTPVKKAPAKTPATEILSVHAATSMAVKDNVSVDIGRLFVLPIGNIASYDNPRYEPEHLYEQGYILFGNPKVEEYNEEKKEFVSLVHLALSDEMEHVRQYVDLIEAYEGPVMRLLSPQNKVVVIGTEAECKAKLKEQNEKAGWKLEKHPSAPQSIVELAEDIFLYSQLTPIEVRQHGGKITGMDGGRRIAAILYLHAKSRVLRADKAEAELFGSGVPKEYPAVVQATELKATGDDFLLACKINLSRKQFTPLQEGRVYHDMLKKNNPDTGKHFTMKEAATALQVEYGTFRNRESLWRDPEYDDKNKRQKGLTDSERRKVALGEMTVTAASRKALGERHYSESGAPASNRNRGIPLSEMQSLFDKTSSKDAVRRQAIADCMGMTLKAAEEESEKRIQNQDRIELQKHERKNRRRNKKTQAA